MDFSAAAPVRLTSNRAGCITLGVTSQLGGAVPTDFAIYLAELKRVEIKVLIFLGPPPYPKVEVEGIPTLGVYQEIEIDLVHGRTGRSSKLFAVYDPALASGLARRRCAAALARPYLGDPVPPIILVGGTRAGGDTSVQTLERAGGACVLQVGIFSPCDPGEDARDRSYGGTIVDIDLDDRDWPLVPRFMDFSLSRRP